VSQAWSDRHVLYAYSMAAVVPEVPRVLIRSQLMFCCSYQAFMLNMSALAASSGVDLLVIGTELSATETQSA
jgi:hypothetical protein